MKIMKKIIILSFLILSFIFTFDSFAGNCAFSSWSSLTDNLNGCEWNITKVVTNSSAYKIEDWFKDIIYDWVKNISVLLSIFAAGAIVYGWFMMVISGWEEEKIKKGKDIVKWSIIWFIWLISAGAIISIVINFMYSLG